MGEEEHGQRSEEAPDEGEETTDEPDAEEESKGMERDPLSDY